MAVILDPQGPLSFPCENTTVPTVKKVPYPAAIKSMALEEEQ